LIFPIVASSKLYTSTILVRTYKYEAALAGCQEKFVKIRKIWLNFQDLQKFHKISKIGLVPEGRLAIPGLLYKEEKFTYEPYEQEE
jgi:hypothetical protein